MKHRRLTTVLASAMAMLLSLSMMGCGSIPDIAPSSSKETKLEPTVSSDALITPGVLTVGLDYSYAPFAGESNGRVVGIDADVASALAQQLGLTVEFVDVGTGGGPNAVANKTCDVFLSFEKKDATNSLASYAGTYIYDAASVFTLKSTASRGSVDTKSLTGSTIAAQSGRATAELVKSLYGSSSLVDEDNLIDAFSALEDGDVQYAAASGIVGSYIITSYNDIVWGGALETPREIGAGVASGNTELQASISAALTTLEENGTIDVIISKWIGAPLDFVSTASAASSATTSTAATTATATATATAATTTEQAATEEAATDQAATDEAAAADQAATDEAATDQAATDQATDQAAADQAAA